MGKVILILINNTLAALGQTAIFSQNSVKNIMAAVVGNLLRCYYAAPDVNSNLKLS
jgi:hypothetical protein